MKILARLTFDLNRPFYVAATSYYKCFLSNAELDFVLKHSRGNLQISTTFLDFKNVLAFQNEVDEEHSNKYSCSGPPVFKSGSCRLRFP